MDKMKALFRTWADWWWQGMTIHARQVCRDESEILDRIRVGGKR